MADTNDSSDLADRSARLSNLRERYDREDEEQALAWCRTQWGHLGGPINPVFDVMLAKGGAAALLMRAEVETEVGRQQFLANFSWPQDVRPPTLEQLKIARALCASVAAAIMIGDDPFIWAQVSRALGEVGSKTNSRLAALEVVEDVLNYRKRCDEYISSYPAERAEVDEELDTRCRQALVHLGQIDPRFESATIERFLELLRASNIGRVGIAVKLTMETGAFGSERRRNETEKEYLQRVRKDFDEATAAQRRARKPLPG